MGTMWLQTSNGRLIHLPVVGADVNSPDDAIKVPTSVLATTDRCLSNQIQVVVAGHGTVTFDFTIPGRTGTCNQCGQCCSHPIASCPNPGDCGYILDTKSGTHNCQYLTVLPGGQKGIGKVNGTKCSVRDNILNVSKGCSTFPDRASDVANCPACGFTFTG
jgi:hypothetical protein